MREKSQMKTKEKKKGNNDQGEHMFQKMVYTTIICLEVLLLVILLLLVLGGIGLLLLLGLLGGLVAHGLLGVLRGAPRLVHEVLDVLLVVGHDDVVEDRAGLDLPEVEAHAGEGLARQVELGVGLVLGVGDLLRLPLALVRGVGDALRLPLPLELGVGDLRGLPLAVLRLIPVVGLLGVGVGDGLGLLVPVLGLLVLGVVHLGLVDPVGGLLVAGVVDLLGLQELPVLLEAAALAALAVDAHLVRVVGVEDEGVDVRELVVLAAGLLLPQQVLAVVVEDEVDLLRVAADVGAEHDEVLGVAGELLLLEVGHHLEVAAAAVDALVVLDREGHDELLVLVGEGLGELAGERVEAGVLGGLDAGVDVLVAVRAAGGEGELAEVVLGGGLHPAVLEGLVEGLRVEDLGVGGAHECEQQQEGCLHP
eukprot:PhM_4_TR3556/c0_g1_i1/m.67876